jgi:hypothetical protein
VPKTNVKICISLKIKKAAAVASPMEINVSNIENTTGIGERNTSKKIIKIIVRVIVPIMATSL